MFKQIPVAVAVLLIGSSVGAIEPDAVILNQPNSPLALKDYACDYMDESDGLKARGVVHILSFRNEELKLIEAVRFRFITFNAFREYRANLEAYDLTFLSTFAPKLVGPHVGTEFGAWVQWSAADLSFGGALAYVDAVRFSDGTVWKANIDALLPQIRKRIPGFSASVLSMPAEAAEPVRKELNLKLEDSK